MTEYSALYRAVSDVEWEFVQQHGNFGFAPSGGGKYFALSAEGARQFAGMGFNSGTTMYITQITIPSMLLVQGFEFDDVGGAGISVHFADDVLPDLYRMMSVVDLVEVVTHDQR